MTFINKRITNMDETRGRPRQIIDRNMDRDLYFG